MVFFLLFDRKIQTLAFSDCKFSLFLQNWLNLLGQPKKNERENQCKRKKETKRERKVETKYEGRNKQTKKY